MIYENELERAKMKDRDGKNGPRARDLRNYLIKPREDEIPIKFYLIEEEYDDEEDSDVYTGERRRPVR